ncbi:MAG: endonuclease [Bacteroidales bacterium]|nr:endonuclease [Bacteroidales bacterium]
MKRILTLCTFLVLCFSAVSWGGEKPLRLLYWNIQNGMWSGQEDNYNAFVSWVKERRPDICVWCEAETIYKTGTDNKLSAEDRYLVGGWKKLARRYGHRYIYVGAHRDSYPQVITSRYPIKNISRITGSAPDSIIVHGAAWAKLRVRGKTLNIVTLHSSPMSCDFRLKTASKEAQKADAANHGGDKYRRKEMELICRNTILTDPKASDGLWLMMGDFNSVSRKDNAYYCYPTDDPRFLTHDYILDNTPYIDVVKEKHPDGFFRSAQSNTRIDFVYATPAFMDRVTGADIIEDSYTTPVRSAEVHNFFRPSDHLPILVDFSL